MTWLLALRYAFRDLRGGVRGFYTFIACLALGVATIAAVQSLASGLRASIAAEGQTILGGDVDFSLIHREATDAEDAFLREAGRVSKVSSLRAMARPPETRQLLVEVKAVDDAYPLYGRVRLRSGRPLHAVLDAGDAGPIPAVVDESLLLTADLALGDRFTLGRLDVRVADVIEAEPDRLSSGVGFGPRVLLSLEAIEQSGLTGRGSLVRWHYRVAGVDGMLTDGELNELIGDAQAAFPEAGWRVRSRTEAAPGLERSVDQFAQFLTLVGLTALAVGGVGVANAVRAFVQRKRLSIGILRALGADDRFIVSTFLVQVLCLALIGVMIGVALGAAAPFVAASLLDGLLPVGALRSLFPAALAIAALFGLLTALTFGLWPLAGTYRVNVAALFRGSGEPETGTPLAFIVATLTAGLLLCGLAVATGDDPILALNFLISAAVAFAVLRAVAFIVTVLARMAPRSRLVAVRLALGNIHRIGALTTTVTISLGLSLTLMITLTLVDGNLRDTLTSRLPDSAPNFFFVDIQDRERSAFINFLEAQAPGAAIASQPMLRGRIVAINDTRSADWPDTEASWVLRGDRGITYASAPPQNSAIVAGEWWDESHSGANVVSFAAELADELGVSVGDTLRVNVLGREVEARIANLRTVEWESLSINFVMVFSPNVFAGAPHGHLATLTLPEAEDEAVELNVLSAVSNEFPTVTTVRVKDALESVNSVVSDLATAIRAAAAVTLVTSLLVLGGTLAASHRARIYDAVVLKTLGASRGTIISAYALEYVLLALGATVFAVLAGSLAAFGIAGGLMELQFAVLPVPVMGVAGAAILITVALGLIGTWRALSVAPARVLRDL